MRYGLIMAALIAAGPSLAGEDVVTISECRDGYMMGMHCDATNHSATAIASVHYGYRITQEDRAVPWGEQNFIDDDMPSLSFDIPGGIEPGETVEIITLDMFTPERADPDLIRYEFRIIEALDVNGDPISH